MPYTVTALFRSTPTHPAFSLFHISFSSYHYPNFTAPHDYTTQPAPAATATNAIGPSFGLFMASIAIEYKNSI